MAPSGRQIAIGGAAGGVSAAVLLGIALLQPFEGRVLHVYPDPVTKSRPWTYCDGETQSPRLGHTYTDAECDKETLALADTIDGQIVACMASPGPLPPMVEAAFLSLTWNIGVEAFCASSIAAYVHQGKLIAACDRITAFDGVNVDGQHKQIPGLVVRRGGERDYCLQGVWDN